MKHCHLFSHPRKKTESFFNFHITIPLISFPISQICSSCYSDSSGTNSSHLNSIQWQITSKISILNWVQLLSASFSLALQWLHPFFPFIYNISLLLVHLAKSYLPTKTSKGKVIRDFTLKSSVLFLHAAIAHWMHTPTKSRVLTGLKLSLHMSPTVDREYLKDREKVCSCSSLHLPNLTQCLSHSEFLMIAE